MAVDGFLDLWLAHKAKNLEPNTHEIYEDYARRYLRPKLGKYKIQDLNGLAIQQAYSTLLKRGLSNRTVRYAHSILHKVLADARKTWHLVGRNAADDVELPSKKKGKKQAI